jgi:hypothetical protein
MVRAPIGTAQRYSGQVEQIEDVAEVELVLEREAENVKARDRSARFEAPERYASPPHVLGHIWPWRKDPFARNLWLQVENVVEKTQTEMGHPDFVDIRKGKGELDGYRGVVLVYRVVFLTKIARRLRHSGQKACTADG